MTQLFEAAKLALEALEEIALEGMSGTGQETLDEINAWRARQVRKFIAIAARQLEPLRTAIKDAEEQKPVAWRYNGKLHEFDPSDWATGPVTPLYTSPPAKPWVGLTDEEIDEAERLAHIRHQKHKFSIRGQQITPADDPKWHYAHAIERILEEKNT